MVPVKGHQLHCVYMVDTRTPRPGAPAPPVAPAHAVGAASSLFERVNATSPQPAGDLVAGRVTLDDTPGDVTTTRQPRLVAYRTTRDELLLDLHLQLDAPHDQLAELRAATAAPEHVHLDGRPLPDYAAAIPAVGCIDAFGEVLQLVGLDRRQVDVFRPTPAPEHDTEPGRAPAHIDTARVAALTGHDEGDTVYPPAANPPGSLAALAPTVWLLCAAVGGLDTWHLWSARLLMTYRKRLLRLVHTGYDLSAAFVDASPEAARGIAARARVLDGAALFPPGPFPDPTLAACHSAGADLLGITAGIKQADTLLSGLSHAVAFRSPHPHAPGGGARRLISRLLSRARSRSSGPEATPGPPHSALG